MGCLHLQIDLNKYKLLECIEYHGCPDEGQDFRLRHC